MSQQIQASIPSPVSPAAAPAVDQGSVGTPQWVPQTQAPPTQAVASVPMHQQPSQAALVSDPSTNNQYSQSTSPSSPSNPWEAAMGSLERVLSQVNSTSLSQTPQSYYQAEQAQATPQNSQTLQAQPWAYQAPQAAQTLPTSVTPTQASYPTSTETKAGISDVTAEVVSHFGIEAPGILNQYACGLEDLLVNQATQLDTIAARHDAMQTILTDPDHLANYTDRYFTEVVPVDVDDNALAMQGQQVGQAYQQTYDMPAPSAGVAGSQQGVAPQQQWDQFTDVMNRNPENAWRVLGAMGPEAMRSKLLFMDPS